jgi:hypothetical protein
LIINLRFYVPLKNFSLICRHQCRWRAAKFRPMLGAQALWAGRGLYRATPTVTAVNTTLSDRMDNSNKRLTSQSCFNMGITVAQFVLSYMYLKPLTLSLQKTDYGMVIAFDEAQNTLNTLHRNVTHWSTFALSDFYPNKLHI